MIPREKDFGAVILAGGQSRRMGRCKALLTVDGQTLLARTAQQLTAFSELLLSANDPALARQVPARLVRDNYPNGGPLAGLEAALTVSRHEALVCVPCDLPHLTAEVPRALAARLPPEADAMVFVDRTGRVHPLCGVYRRRILPVLRRQLERRALRVTELLECVQSVYLPADGLVPDEVFHNLNTPEDLRKL